MLQNIDFDKMIKVLNENHLYVVIIVLILAKFNNKLIFINIYD